MPYRDRLEARIAKKATQAITTFGLIGEGDRILVALSGGKDSWALLQILDVLRRRAEIDFSFFAVTIDSGYEGFATGEIAAACQARGWPFQLVPTTIGAVMDEILEPGETPCSLCGRLRRGVLYRIARETGATKIALGHHADDCMETLLLNIFFEGTLKAMPARLVADAGGHVVIRPLVYVSEAETAAYAAESRLPVVSCCCRACGDLSLKRQRVKRLLFDLEREHPGVKSSMLRALRNVVPSHLLDARLHPVPSLALAAASRLDPAGEASAAEEPAS